MAATSNAPGAARYLPTERDLDALRGAAETCHGCSFFEDATQTVFGNGHPGAPIMLVGEQPGDQEDRAGEPFVGPAGRLLDRALEDAGIDLPGADSDTYNSVGGYVFGELGRLPKRGDSITVDGYTVRVEAVRENRIEAVRISRSSGGSSVRGDA